MHDWIKEDTPLFAQATAHKKLIHEQFSLRNRDGSSTAVQILSNYASIYTMQSVSEWFEVSLRQVKKARMHARMFGLGMPVAASHKQSYHAWRIPQSSLTNFMSFMVDRDLVRLKPASDTAEATSLELLCSKPDFIKMYRTQFGEDGLSDSFILEFLDTHGIANLHHHECVCAACMSGSAAGTAAKATMLDLHKECTQRRGSDQVHGVSTTATPAASPQTPAQTDGAASNSTHATTQPAMAAQPSVAIHRQATDSQGASGGPTGQGPDESSVHSKYANWIDASKPPCSVDVNPYGKYQSAEVLADLADKAVSHCRFGLAGCCTKAAKADAWPDCATHCRNYALSETNDPCSCSCQSCSDAGHSHPMSCSECNAMFHMFGYMHSMIEALAPHKPAEVVEEWRATVQEQYEGMKLLMGHKLRSVHQDEARLEVLHNMGFDEAVVTIDFMAKWLPLERVESHADSFGKSGTSLHGMNIIMKCLPETLQKRVDDWSKLSEEERINLKVDIANAGAHAAHCDATCMSEFLCVHVSHAADDP